MKRIYLRTARERAGLTQGQLADKSGVPQPTISKLETRGDISPEFVTVANLADALNRDPRALRFGPDPKTQKAQEELSA